jgi:hypothetical protein
VGSGLALAARFAEAKGALLVVIRSGAAVEQPFQEMLVRRAGQPAVIIDLPRGAERSLLPAWRSDQLTVAALYRDGDLGFKRNLAMVLARLCGWEVMLFLDDDIRATPASDIGNRPARTDPLSRLDDVLADFAVYPDLQAAGYFRLDYDDNSVVCHARRLVGLPQETFISGGALAVRCQGDLPMFSAAYNEDWLFFLLLMLRGRHANPSSAVKYVGTVHQDACYSFAMPRARAEELGDVLAEGLFNLLREPWQELLAAASSPAFWSRAIADRCQMIHAVLGELYRRGNGIGIMADAEAALRAAYAVYSGEPEQPANALAEFFDAFLQDQEEWSRLLTSLTPTCSADVLSLEEALSMAGLSKHSRHYAGAAAPVPRRWAS